MTFVVPWLQLAHPNRDARRTAARTPFANIASFDVFFKLQISQAHLRCTVKPGAAGNERGRLRYFSLTLRGSESAWMPLVTLPAPVLTASAAAAAVPLLLPEGPFSSSSETVLGSSSTSSVSVRSSV